MIDCKNCQVSKIDCFASAECEITCEEAKLIYNKIYKKGILECLEWLLNGCFDSRFYDDLSVDDGDVYAVLNKPNLDIVADIIAKEIKGEH